jgi:urease accessory protein
MFKGNLLHLLHLADTALPIGGFSHSAGLETYVQAGIVHDKTTAFEFVAQQLSQNISYTDAAFVSLAYDAVGSNDFDEIVHLDGTCNALKLPSEMRLASNKLGTRVLKIFNQQQSLPIAEQYMKHIQIRQAFGHYCIAFGLLAKELKIEKQDALTGFFYNAATGIVTNSVKLIPLGQQDGQAILMSLFPLIDDLVQKCMQPDEDLIGYCCSGFDIRCMQHEQLYSRLYMS